MSQTKVKSGLLNFPDQTDFVKLPSGTTAQRPVSPEKGYSRYNTTDNKLEFWNGTVWQQLPGVVAPIITSVSYPGDDLAADPAGGQTITINGSDFITGATVTVGGTTPSVITFVSATEITFEAPAKAAGDYDIVVTNVDGGNATSVDGISYNGVPSWTTPAGNLGTFPAGSTIPTITLVATEPDSGVISYSVTTGALPTGLTLTGADIDGNVPTPAGETTYNFSVTASDDENQSTERAFNIVVYLQVTNTVSEVDPFGDSSGVALYRLENNANDEGGVYNGTPTNVTYGTGVFGQAGVFDTASQSQIQLPIGSPFDDSDTIKTISAWVKLDTPTSRIRGIYSLTTNDLTFFEFRYIGDGNYISVFARNGSSANQIHYQAYLPSPQDTNWHHAVTTFDGTNVKIYFDGQDIPITITKTGSATNSSWISYPNYSANPIPTIGKSRTDDSYSDGSIDQVRIFNRALTPLEVESLYRERIVVCGGQADTLDILGDNSCIAAYQLNGNANDLSGNYSGTPTNVSYGVGEFDLAGVFNGTSSFVNLGQQDQFANSQVSFSTWINPSVFTNSSRVILASTNGGSFAEYDFALYFRDDNTSGFIGTEVGQSSSIYEAKYTTTTAIPLNTWTHIVLTFDTTLGTNITKVFINGVSQSLTSTYPPGGTFSGSILNSTLNLNIGKRNISGSELYFNGSIDQVRIFNKALSAGEVTTLYNETACEVLACSGTTNTLDILGDSSCVAAYPLDGSPLDLSGNYNGVQTDVTYPVGKYDLAGSFNGSSSRITLGTNTPLNNFGGEQTVSFWIKPNNVERSAIVGYRNDSTLYWSLIERLSDNTIRLLFRGGGATLITPTTTQTINVNQWNYVVVTINSSNVIIYINNVAQTFTNTIGAFSNSETSYIGYSTDVDSGSFNGFIDQVRIFNKALSAAEVTTLYNETACN